MLIMKNAFTSMTTRIGILLSTNIIKVWMKISLYSVNNPIMIYVEWARMLSDCICCLYLLINTTMMGNIFYLNFLFCTSFNLDLLVFCIEHKMHPPIKQKELCIRSNTGIMKWLLSTSGMMDSTVISRILSSSRCR